MFARAETMLKLLCLATALGTANADRNTSRRLQAGGCPDTDINQDGIVAVDDLLALLAVYGSSSSAADFDGNGLVSVEDLLILLADYGAETSCGDASTQVGVTFVHCLPGAGMIESLEECQAAAETIGLPWASGAGTEWASGCLFHGGNVYYSDHADGTTQNPTDAYICNVAGPVLTYTHCLPGEGMIESMAECQAAAASIGATWASGAGTEWASGCLFHNGGVYYSNHEDGTTQNPTDAYICNSP